ncbi:Uncharacterised protein [uncultured archaeon]|nr:Uncharacterised protein [uncultured archaeon]
MKQILSYNIHNVLKFQIILNKKFNLIDYLNVEHRFFEVDSIDKPDIILNIGKFKPSNEDCYILDNKYYIKENYFYCKDSIDKTKWELEILGFESGDTVMNFDIKVPGILGLLPILGAHNLFISPLIDYKLSKKGYFLLHSAGLSKDKKAFLLSGMGGAFKTTLAMDFTRKAGFDFMGDERVILHGKNVLSYPVGLVSFGYRCKFLQTEKKRNILDKINLIKYNFNNYYHLDRTDVNVAEMSKLCALFFISRQSERERLTIRETDLQKAIDRLVINNKIEMNHAYMPNLMGISMNRFLEYMLVYSFIFPNSLISTHWENMKKNLKVMLEEIPIYEIELPKEYDNNVFNDIQNYVKSVDY